MKNIKNFVLGIGIFAEGFMCLYKITEENYPNTFSIPTDSFNYYRLLEGESYMYTRVGYYPDGYGDNTDPVLVIHECETESENPSSMTADMQVNSQSVSSSLTGAGYIITLTELNVDGEEDVRLQVNTTGDTWQFQGEFVEANEYGSVTLSYNPTSEYNTIQAFNVSSEENVRVNSAFGPYSEISGYTVGGSASLDVQNEEMTDGFLLQDVAMLPSLRLESATGDNTELPYYTELTAMGALPTASEITISITADWDCTSETGFVDIDLTPTAIMSAIDECEAAGDAVMEMGDTCANLQESNEK